MLHVNVEPAEESLLRTIGEGLRAYNVSAGGAPKKAPEFVVTLRDKGGALVGGITSRLFLGGLTIERVWVETAHRGAGHGRALLAVAEAEGLRRGAAMAHLDTFTFQARGFYERCGYEVFGTLDYPGGVQRFYLRKSLRGPGFTAGE